MQIEGTRLWKWILIYIVTLGIGWLLFPAAWGGVNAFLVGAKLAEDPKFHQELRQIFSEEEIRQLDVYSTRKLPEEKRKALESLLKKRFKERNWLPIHLLVSAVTFAILGLILGLFSLYRYAALVPVGLLIVTWPSLTAEQFEVYTKWLTVVAGLSTQLASIYLFSFAFHQLRKKLPRNREL